MERKLLQIAFAPGVPAIGIISLAGELIFAWLWQGRVAGAARRSVLT